MNVADLIQQTRRLLLGASRATLNTLDGAINNTATTVTLRFDLAATLGVASYLVIDDEIMYVHERNQAQRTLTVQRGVLGTTAAAHADGALVESNPRFPQPAIRDALQAEIRSWPKTVHAVGSVTLTVPTGSYAVDLTNVPAGFYDILEVLAEPTATAPFAEMWRPVGYRVERGLPVADFPSGAALFTHTAGPATLRVTYSAPFDTSTFTDATNLEDDIGLEPSMFDIPPNGAVWRLLSGQEVVRTAMEAQGQVRDSDHSPVGQTIRAASVFLQYRDQRLAQEGQRLLNRYPWAVIR